ADYPPGTKLFLRAEPLHPGAQPTLLDVDGHRITAFLTNSPRWHGPTLDARHRARGRCENRIKTLKNSGMRKLPFFDFAANQAWADIAALASNLIAWLQISAIPTSHRARFWDVKRFRYRLFSTAGKITRHGRQTRILLPETAPEKDLIAAILAAIKDLRATFKPPVAIPI
ncbi:IS1380 family transposase, partial [Arthrobacter sp. H14]|uniref:IS1380 family transposase n=1 Tax=Arthrobacter sp. H14 TaxID=1312959 RepID=UPI00047E5CA2